MEPKQKIHFIGVGGIGMSGLARLWLHEGAAVSGSDLVETENSKKLEAVGISVVYEQSASNVTADLDLVVYTEGVTPDTAGWVELEAARASGVRTVSYFEALAEVANEYYLIAVCGAHGKTTTTAMLIDILEEASYDPTAIVGSLRSKTGSNFRAGKSKYFIAEACEWKRHFLHLQPQVLVITNIEHEHVDYYPDLPATQAAYAELVVKIPEDGAVIADTKDPKVVPVLVGAKCPVINYNDELDLTLVLKQPGLHNRQNAAAAKTAAQFIGIEERDINEALINFSGTWRRFEYKGDVNNAPVYDDYAHHPTEITAAILGAKEAHPDKALTVVFQPHTFSRTKALYEDFVLALTKADRVMMLPIYAARETDDGTVSSEMITASLQEKGIDAAHYHTLEAAALAAKEAAGPEDVILCLGAGSVTKVANLLTE